MTETSALPVEELVSIQPLLEKLVIDPAIIRVGIGYPLNHSDRHIDDMIDKIISESRRRMEPASGYKIFNDLLAEPDYKTLHFGGLDFRTEKIITVQMKKAVAVAVFLCTIGPGMENWSRQLIDNGDYLKGYIVDAVASEAVEQAVEQTHNYLEAQMRELGLGITNRYSPGYCNWPVAEQHLLFSLLPPGYCGIRLTETALMIPIKSVSGIIGIGPDVKRRGYACNLCDDKQCIYRKIKT
ncbi:MAG TPA: vitamin B12 dependent-methionine synthase activation domain-containing protein [bacterium]|nr:vitamin B12 dependent-methionine synthase activation domain-containing protein [bacterium]HPN45510.1 vitamin B12 dependent-methionine synthase activation domain-containing protein [bacterium]